MLLVKKKERKDLGKDNIDMMEKLTRGGKLKSGRLLSLGENLLSNPSLIRVALHKDKHKVSKNIWRKCVAYNKDIKKFNCGMKLLKHFESLLTGKDNEASNTATTTKPKSLLSTNYSMLLSFKMMNRQQDDKDKIPGKMVERVALWNSKWQYEPNPPRPVKPYEMNEFNQANGTPVDIVIATSTTEEENNTTTKESASSHNVDDHNGYNDVDTEAVLYFLKNVQQAAV